MSQLLPQEKLIEIQHASDIVNVISEYVVLKNAGKNHVGLCPFHNEKTPSFTVNSQNQFYKCFGCGEAGTVYTFLMKYNGVKFLEAVKILAERAGIELPDAGGVAKDDANSVLYEINSYFAKFFHDNLMNSSLAKSVQKYVSDRGISDEIVKRFGIGYSLDSWDSALIKANANNFDTETLENAGIILKRQKGTGFYDRFRNRLMFPLHNETGSVIGFGARTLDGSQPKYLNSPESKIFNKRRVLYGLNFAKNSIAKKQEAIVLEGYTDVIMAHQHGIDWCVGVMGTSLTLEHVKLLRRYCGEVVLILDPDEAGIKSADKSAGLFVENGLDVKIVQLPEGYDPCEFLVSKGKDAFLEQINNAVGFFEFKMNVARESGDLSSVSGKTKVFKDIISTVVKIPDILKRNIQIKDIAEKIKIDESVLRVYLGSDKDVKVKQISSSSNPPYFRQDFKNCGAGKGDYSLRSKSASYYIETDLIRLMIFDNKFIPAVKADIGLSNFHDEGLRNICQLIFDEYASKGSVNGTELFTRFTESFMHKMLANIISVEHSDENGEDILEGCKQYIKKRLNKEEIKRTKDRTLNLNNDIKDEAKTGSSNDELNLMLKEFHKKNKEFQFNKLDRKNRIRFLESKEDAIV